MRFNSVIYFAKYEEGELEKATMLLKDVSLVTEVKETSNVLRKQETRQDWK